MEPIAAQAFHQGGRALARKRRGAGCTSPPCSYLCRPGCPHYAPRLASCQGVLLVHGVRGGGHQPIEHLPNASSTYDTRVSRRRSVIPSIWGRNQEHESRQRVMGDPQPSPSSSQAQRNIHRTSQQRRQGVGIGAHPSRVSYLVVAGAKGQRDEHLEDLAVGHWGALQASAQHVTPI